MKNRSIPKIFILAFAAVTFFAVTGLKSKPGDDIYDKINKNLEKFGKVYREISLNYVDEIDSDKFVKAGIEGMLSTLDPYTGFYDELSFNEIDLVTNGKYGGIGISVGVRGSHIVITDVMNGYEAQRRGLKIGDKLVTVDGQVVDPATMTDLNKIVRGTVGTPLFLQVERDGTVLDFNLTREEIILKNVSYFGFIGDESEGIGYFKLDRFTSNTENEVDNVIKTLKSRRELNGLIIDLRNNTGGLLDAASGLLNKILPRNSLVTIIKGNRPDSEKKVFSNQEPLISPNVPVVVLINENTASASEIVAGAIQDLDRGVIVGEKSFGKGLVQVVKNIGDNSQLRITTSRYFTPSGRWIQSKDYFKENQGGVFSNTREFSQQEFKTLNNRIVYAYGGITPDIEVNLMGESEIHRELSRNDMFFKFASYYLDRNPLTQVFKSDERTFDEFLSFLNQNNFVYRSEADKKLSELRSLASGQSYSQEFLDKLSILESEIESKEQQDLVMFKNEILRSIEAEINKRVIEEFEQVRASLDSDMQLFEAIQIIKDSERYNRILGK